MSKMTHVSYSRAAAKAVDQRRFDDDVDVRDEAINVLERSAFAVKACPKLYPDWNSFHHVPICRPAENVSQEQSSRNSIYNGLVTAQLLPLKHVPSYIQIGTHSIMFRYAGQPRTCRRCDGAGHEAQRCQRYKCHDCGKIGHNTDACNQDPMCPFCFSPNHSLQSCRDYWECVEDLGEVDPVELVKDDPQQSQESKETHFTCKADTVALSRIWEGQCFFSFGSSHSAGVVVLLNKNFSHKLSSCSYDINGRWFNLSLDIDSTALQLINIYATNTIGDKHHLQAARKRLYNLDMIRISGARIRSKELYFSEFKKSLRYFFSLENKRQQRKLYSNKEHLSDRKKIVNGEKHRKISPKESNWPGKQHNNSGHVTSFQASKVRPQGYRESHREKPEMAIIGDSIVGGINRRDINTETKDYFVAVKTFKEATVDGMDSYIIPTIKKQPEGLIIHCATNNLRKDDPDIIASKILSLAFEAKQKIKHVAVSSLIARGDSDIMENRRYHVNQTLERSLAPYGICFIKHNNIDIDWRDPLWKDGIHLSDHGNAKFTGNFIRFLNEP
eukprot:gene6719-7479_t